MTSQGCGVLRYLAFLSLIIASWCLIANASPNANEDEGKTWALLVAGSKGYMNYRHQADVCHAYQILKKGGMNDENIIVFMYDDIALDEDNPKRGVIINKPNGKDVYKGVPKDYTKDDVNVGNLYAVILGNKSALTGGSGKVLNSSPNDHVFIYYADHGAEGLLGMPVGDPVYAKDLVHVLKKKHDAKGYKSMVFYLEACSSGSMFEGFLPNSINIYATTAANAHESSYGTYCPGEDHVPPEYHTCLGDLYSISWMEDCDAEDLHTETLAKQYQLVRKRTNTSHVMEYGDMSHRQDVLSTYMGGAPAVYHSYTSSSVKDTSSPSISTVVSQRDADLLYFQHKFDRAPSGSQEKLEAQKQLVEEIAQREHVDYSVNKIGELLFGNEMSSKVLMNVRPPGQPLVDDWDCFKTLLGTYERHCGALARYGRKYARAIANICNAGISMEKMDAASDEACSKKPHL